MSTLKVDNIQHTNGTDAMTIDSDGSVQLKKYVTGSYAASSTWTPGANVVPSWALDVTMVFTEVSHVTQGDEPGPQVYVGGSTAPTGSYNYVWWYMGNGASITLNDFRTAGHTWLRAGGFTNPNNIFSGSITFSRTSTSSYIYAFECQPGNKGYAYNHGWTGTVNLSGPISGLGWATNSSAGFNSGTARVFWS